jgi:hypothetical protein
MMVAVPLSVLDAFVLWWIFFALHSTMKILSLRQNRIKLLLYHRFRTLLGFFAVGEFSITLSFLLFASRARRDGRWRVRFWRAALTANCADVDVVVAAAAGAVTRAVVAAVGLCVL